MLAISLYILPLTGICLATNNIWRPYSYWLDELYSVTASSLGFSEMIRAMLADVHPPLYQLMLWLWMRLLSDHEPSTRGFSLICCLSALAYLYLWSKRFDYWTRILTVSFFATSWLFICYAQETRSYALILLLSTLLTGLFAIDDRSEKSLWQIISIAVLLGLTHYFGLLLSSAVLCWLFFQNIRKFQRLFVLTIAGLVLLAWPITEYLCGSLGSKTGGRFWIQVNGPLETLEIFFYSIAPVLRTWGNYVNHVLLTISIVTIFFLLVYRLKKFTNLTVFSEKSLILKLTFCLFWVLGAAMAIDMNTPISTDRNYIVLLPIVSVMFGFAVSVFTRLRYASIGVMILMLVWGKLQLDHAQTLLTAKWYPLQNWAEASEYLVANALGNRLYYLRPSDSDENDRIFNYYVNRFSKGSIKVEPLYADMLADISSPAMVLFGATTSDTIAKIQSSEVLSVKKIIYPAQNRVNSTGVLIF